MGPAMTPAKDPAVLMEAKTEAVLDPPMSVAVAQVVG